MPRHYLAWLALTLTSCDCGPTTTFDPELDGSLLIGEGFVLGPEDAAADAGSDLGSEDLGAGMELGTPDLAGPDLASPDLGDPCAPELLTVFEAANALAMADALDGRSLRLTGTASVGPVLCTDMPCEGGGICCNRCRADLFLGGFQLAPSECTGTSTVGCQGSPCDPLVCSPPLIIDLPAGVDGRVEAGPPRRFQIFRVAPP